MLHIPVTEHELSCGFFNIVPSFGNSHADDTDISVSNLVKYGLRGFHTPKKSDERADPVCLIMSVPSAYCQGVFTILSFQYPVEPFVAREKHGSADTPFLLVRIFKQPVCIIFFVRPVEVTYSYMQDSCLDAVSVVMIRMYLCFSVHYGNN